MRARDKIGIFEMIHNGRHVSDEFGRGHDAARYNSIIVFPST